MQNVSSLYEQLNQNANHFYEVKLVINGVTYTEDKIFSITTDTAMFSGSPEIGKAVSSEIEVKMINPQEEIPTMAVVIPYVRVGADVEASSTVAMDGDIVDCGTAAEMDGDVVVFGEQAYMDEDVVGFHGLKERMYSEWLQMGYYYIDTREIARSESGVFVLTLHGYDAMLKAEQDFVSDTITGDSIDTAMVAEIASIIGVTVDSRTYTVMDKAYTIPLPTGYTCREVLGYIAAMYVGCFTITETGKLRLVSLLELPPETNHLVDENSDNITFGGDRILV